MDHKFSARFLEKYELVRQLGQGGMGTVYLARHRALDRLVAVKALLHLDERQLRWFQREGRALARLVHPRIVAVHDADEEGVPYLVCEFVEGQSLRELIDSKQKISPERAVRLVAGVLEGLAHAHAEGVVHRDIKPENILLTLSGEVKVTDFGLAHVHPQGGAPQAPASSPGMIAGTPSYMPPEQARGETCTTKSDIYACGVMLFEMLAGYAPFRVPSTPEVLTRHLQEQGPHLGPLRDDVPEALARIVTRAVAKEPEERWGSADEFRAALDAVYPPPLPASGRTALSGAGASAGGVPALVRALVITSAAVFGMWAAGTGPQKPAIAPSASAAEAAPASPR